MTTLLDSLGVDGRKRIACPVHGGIDKNCLVNTESNTWHCFSHNCHDEIGKSLDDLARYLGLSHSFKAVRSNKTFVKTVKPINKLLNTDQLFKQKFTSRYFLRRGFKRHTIANFMAFECSNLRSPFYKRAVIPVFDDTGGLIGYSGRATYPSNIKWLHGPKSLRIHNCLYNLQFAKLHVKNGTIILVEGPLDVWRLYEAGIYNAVATFGTDIYEPQLQLLLNLGIKTVVLMLDPDDAGMTSTLSEDKIGGKLTKYFDVISLRHLIKVDVGEMSPEQLQSVLYEAYKNYPNLR